MKLNAIFATLLLLILLLPLLTESKRRRCRVGESPQTHNCRRRGRKGGSPAPAPAPTTAHRKKTSGKKSSSAEIPAPNPGVSSSAGNASLSSGDALYCGPCSERHCPSFAGYKCKGGVARGFCNCCRECAKVEGELCGGLHDHYGKCDVTLECRFAESVGKRSVLGAGGEKPSDVIMMSHKKTCHKIPKKATGPKCKPACTPEFCLANKKAICSARGVTTGDQSCTGECQHTSCKACFYQEPSPCAMTCAQDDSRCIKRFGNCAKRKICARRKSIPCKKKTSSRGKFVCWVPGCEMQ